MNGALADAGKEIVKVNMTDLWVDIADVHVTLVHLQMCMFEIHSTKIIVFVT